jgi:hypothetical protein
LLLTHSLLLLLLTHSLLLLARELLVVEMLSLLLVYYSHLRR